VKQLDCTVFLEESRDFFEKKLEEFCIEGHALGAVRRTKSMM
jgi:hypothetical protein